MKRPSESLKAKCVLDDVRKDLSAVVALHYPLNFEDHSFRVVNIHYGHLPRELLILIYMKNSCKSPFLGNLRIVDVLNEDVPNT